jgi:hypothetical protein
MNQDHEINSQYKMTTFLMPKTFRLLLTLWLLSFSARNLHAQFNNFPVSSTPFIVHTNTYQWSDFYTSSTFLNLNLLLKDNKQGGDLDVFLRIKLERVGITISNPPDFVASKPIRLSFGSLKSLSGIDISENFLPQNLVLSGLEDSFVRQGGTLPDGLWTLKVTAYEFDGSRGYRQVSNEGIGQLMVFYGQPPMLLAPANTSEIDNSFSPNVLFNWLPKATASIGGLSNIAYEFELWELGDNEDPNEVALGKTPIFTKTVSSPMMIYDAHQQPPLKTGFHYAWRVRVIDATGNNAYENKGYSEVWSFRYGIKCSDTGNLQIKLLGGRTYRLTWNYAKNASSYEINWRERGKSNWQIENSNYNNFDLKLEESLAYEFRVRTVCQSGETGAWSETLEWEKEGEKRSQSSTSSARMSAGTESVGGTSTTTSTTSTPEDDLNKVLNPLGNTVTSGDTNPDKANALLKKPDDNITRCNSGVKTTTASCDDDKSVAYTGGVSLPSPAIGTKLYLNGYEIVLTSGDDKKGEGLLFFPYLMKRIPVEWTSKIDIRQGETTEYGCIVGASDKVQVQGSNAGALSDDLNRQFTALAAWLNDPGSFTGTFGAALEESKKLAAALLDKLAKNEPITPSDYKKYNNVCKAIDKGLDAYKKDIEKLYGTNSQLSQVKALLANISNYKTQLKDHLDCDGTGSIFHKSRSDDNNPILYTSLNVSFGPYIVVSKCKLEATAPLANDVLGSIKAFDDIQKNTVIEIPQTSISYTLTGQTLVVNRKVTTGGQTQQQVFTYVFNEGIVLSKETNGIKINGVLYSGTKVVSSGNFLGLYQNNYTPLSGEKPLAYIYEAVSDGNMYANGFVDKTSYKADCDVQTMDITSPGSVAYTILTRLNDNCIRQLLPEERIKYLNALVGGLGNLTGEYDAIKASIKIMDFTPEKDFAFMLDKIKSTGLLKSYFEKMDDGGMADFGYLVNLWLSNTVYIPPLNEKRIVYYWGKEIKAFDTGMLSGLYNFTIDRVYEAKIINNLIKVNAANEYYVAGSTTTSIFPCEDNSPPIDPYEIVEIRMLTDFNFGLETIHTKGENLKIPAITYYSLIKQKQARDLSVKVKLITLSVTAPLTFAASGWGLAFMILDNATLGADIAINDANVQGFRTKYPEVTRLFNDFKGAYFAGRAVYGIGETVVALRGAIASARSSGTATADELATFTNIERSLGDISSGTEKLGFSNPTLTPTGFKLPSTGNLNVSAEVETLTKIQFKDLVILNETTAPITAEMKLYTTYSSMVESGVMQPVYVRDVSVVIDGATATASLKALKVSTSVEPDLLVLTLANGTKTLAYASQKVAEQVKNDRNNCDYCRITNQVLCSQLKLLKQSTGKDVAVKKLCNSTIGDVELLKIATKLNGMSAKSSFLDDIGGNCTPTNTLCSNINSLTSVLVDSWYVLESWKDHRKDWTHLDKIKSLLTNANVKEVLINEEKENLRKICSNLFSPKTTVKFNSSQSLMEYLNAFEIAVNKYHDKTGFKIRGGSGSGTTNGAAKELTIANTRNLDGGWFGIREMNQLSATNVSRIDWDFDDDAYDCGNNSCQFDVQMVAGQTPRYYEYKSKSMSTSAESGIEINPKQFKSYLSKINSMAELQYVFQVEKLYKTDAKSFEEGLANRFKLRIQFDIDGFFNVVFGNVALRGNLFPIANYPNMNATQYKDAAKIDFSTFIGDTKNSFYNFIKAK